MALEWFSKWRRKPSDLLKLQPPSSRQDVYEAHIHDLDKQITDLNRQMALQAQQLRQSEEFLRDVRRKLERNNPETVRTKAEIDLLAQLVEPLEHVKRATNSTPEAIVNSQWYRSSLIPAYRTLAKALADAGLRSFGKVGENFDPNQHEAIEVVESDVYEEGIIVKVYSSGYLFQGMLVMPAKVYVAKQRTKQEQTA